jgi:two-component system response regulator FixJ
MEGMTGVELCRRMRELDMRVPVIVLTGYIDSPEIDEALSSGEISEVVVKPFVLENLIATIARCLSEDEATNAASR